MSRGGRWEVKCAGRFKLALLKFGTGAMACSLTCTLYVAALFIGLQDMVYTSLRTWHVSRSAADLVYCRPQVRHTALIGR